MFSRWHPAAIVGWAGGGWKLRRRTLPQIGLYLAIALVFLSLFAGPVSAHGNEAGRAFGLTGAALAISCHGVYHLVRAGETMTLDVAFENVSDSSRIYDGSEFSLVPEIGPPVPPVGAQVGRAPLEAGQRLNTTIHFDFDTTRPHGKLLVEWRRRGHSVFLPIPEPAEHYHLRPLGGEVALPLDVRLLLPIGDAERGKALYDGTLGCIACHGDVARPGSNNFGPDLALLAEEAGTRIEGVSAAQYIYDSIREPGAFIAPHCKDGPCQTPSAMPEYASLMTLQDFADVVTYLLGTPQP